MWCSMNAAGHRTNVHQPKFLMFQMSSVYPVSMTTTLKAYGSAKPTRHLNRVWVCQPLSLTRKMTAQQPFARSTVPTKEMSMNIVASVSCPTRNLSGLPKTFRMKRIAFRSVAASPAVANSKP